MSISDGEFNLAGRGIVLGEQLALDLGTAPGDRVTALNLGGPGGGAADIELEVTGLFRCGYREYERSMAFVSLDTAALFLADAPIEIGIKLRRLEADRKVAARWPEFGEISPGSIVSWRVSNRAFFGALRTEKVMMMVLLTLIFVVVAVNIDHALRRMAAERAEDLSILKTLGASPRDVRILFWRHGLTIGGMGGVAGSLLGAAIGGNIDAMLRFLRSLRRIPGSGGTINAFFRNSEVMVQDVLIILFLAVLISSLAAVRAASAAARSKPAEVLRSE